MRFVATMLVLVSLISSAVFAQQAAKPPANIALQLELLKRHVSGQKLRAEMAAAQKSGQGIKLPEEFKARWEKQAETDRENVKWLEGVLKEQGWPGKSLVGPDASRAAFLILQQADVSVLKLYFPLLKEAAAKGEAQPQQAATMEDRILMYEGKKQIYGTQIRHNQLYPVEDEANVDARRAAVGLGPLADYLKVFGLEYKPPQK